NLVQESLPGDKGVSEVELQGEEVRVVLSLLVKQTRSVGDSFLATLQRHPNWLGARHSRNWSAKSLQTPPHIAARDGPQAFVLLDQRGEVRAAGVLTGDRWERPSQQPVNDSRHPLLNLDERDRAQQDPQVSRPETREAAGTNVA